MTTTSPVATQYPLTDGPAPAPSERLIRALEAQLAADVHEIADCRDLAQDSGHPVVRLLLGMIIEDEQRHQVLLQQIVRRLHGKVEDSSMSAALPVPSDSEQLADETTVTRLRALIRDEDEGARYLRHLARQERSLYDGLFGVLLETVARDSQKHAYVLRYLLRKVEGR